MGGYSKIETAYEAVQVHVCRCAKLVHWRGAIVVHAVSAILANNEQPWQYHSSLEMPNAGPFQWLESIVR